MKPTLLATATSLLLWSSPSWIQAQEENLFERLDTNKDGQVAVDEIDADRRRLFERLLRIGDKNSDGKLSREEFTEAVKVRPNEPAPGAPGDRPNLPEPREVLVRFDKNQDGKLSKEEAPDRLKENFDRVDTNKDGSIDADELRQAFMALARGAGPAAGRMTPQIFERMFQERDTNKDGKLTKDEMPEERQEFFARLLGRFDDDGDGALTKEQFVQALQAFQGAMGEGGRRPQGEQKPEGDRKPDASGRPGSERRPEGRPEAGRFMIPPLMTALDTNKDGELSSDEIEKAAQALRTLDKNNDGKITRDEIIPQRQ